MKFHRCRFRRIPSIWSLGGQLYLYLYYICCMWPRVVMHQSNLTQFLGLVFTFLSRLTDWFDWAQWTYNRLFASFPVTFNQKFKIPTSVKQLFWINISLGPWPWFLSWKFPLRPVVYVDVPLFFAHNNFVQQSVIVVVWRSIPSKMSGRSVQP